MKTAQGQRKDLKHGNTAVTKSKQIAEIGLTKMDASRFETLATHPEEVEKAKDHARKTGSIVTRSDVMNQISATHEDRRQREARELREAKRRVEEYDGKGTVEFQAALQNREDKRRIFEALKEDLYKLERNVRHFAIAMRQGNFKKSLAGSDKHERDEIGRELMEMRNTLLQMEAEVMEVDE